MSKKRTGLLAGLFSVLAALFVVLMITPAFGAVSELTGKVALNLTDEVIHRALKAYEDVSVQIL